jgi:CDP-glucose 4,6-dehydratase
MFYSSGKNFWKDKKVFITGHTGFKGSWLCLLLSQLGAKVTGYSLPLDPKKIIFNQIRIKKGIVMKSYYADIRDKKKLLFAISNSKPDIIFHLAAQPIVLDSYKDPMKTFETNFNGTLNLLEIIKKFKIKSSIIVTTDKVYKNDNKNIAFKEASPLGGDDPYSASKSAVEILVDSYNKSFFQNKLFVATVRAGNVVGGGDRSNNRIIPDFFKSFYKKKKLIVRSPSSVRPWQFVLEPLIGYLMVAEANYKKKLSKISQCWNFSPSANKVYNVRFIIKTFIKEFKVNVKYLNIKNKMEKKFLNLSSFKAKKYINWKSYYNVHKTIKEIIVWEKNYKNDNQIIDFCFFQIRSYLKVIQWI